MQNNESFAKKNFGKLFVIAAIPKNSTKAAVKSAKAGANRAESRCKVAFCIGSKFHFHKSFLLFLISFDVLGLSFFPHGPRLLSVKRKI